MDDRREPKVQPVSRTELETTATLLGLIRGGDAAARERLIRRYLPILERWARGRLPSRARDLVDTNDVVQVTLLRALEKVDGFEPRREGAFLAYLRRSLMNQINDHARRVKRMPPTEAIDERITAEEPSPLDRAIGRETMRRYEEALAQLPEDHQEAVVMRIEMGFTHDEVAEAIGSPSANAARMLVARALIRMAEMMDDA